MCGRFVQERSVTELAEVFDAEPLAPTTPGRATTSPRPTPLRSSSSDRMDPAA